MKQYKIIKATKHELVGVIFEYAILKDMQPPKWFQEFEKRNNTRFERIEKRLDEHTIILNKHSEILAEHSEILKRHSEILEKHSEVLAKHSEILERHSGIFERNNLH